MTMKSVMHSKTDIKEFTAYDNTNEVVDKLFKLLLSRYQRSLEISMMGSGFIFDSVQLLYFKCHNINFRCDGP